MTPTPSSRTTDPRLLPVLAAALLGPAGLWWWGRQQPQRPSPLLLASGALLWAAELALAWWLLPQIGQLQQPLFYATLYANAFALAWLLGVLFAPPGEAALDGAYWWGYGLHLLALASWLPVLHPLVRYTSQTQAAPLWSVGLPVLVGVGWVALLRAALPLQRQAPLLPRPRVAKATGWLLALAMAGVVVAFWKLLTLLAKS